MTSRLGTASIQIATQGTDRGSFQGINLGPGLSFVDQGGVFALDVAGRPSIIFRPGIPSNDDHVATWSEVEQAIAHNPNTGVVVLVDTSFGAAVVPATARTNFTKRSSISALNVLEGATLTVASGGQLINIASLDGGIIITGAPATVSPILITGSSLGLVMRQGSAVVSGAGTLVAMISVATDAVISLIEGSRIDNAASPLVGLVLVAPTKTLTFVIIQAVVTAMLPTWLEGDATTTIQFIHDASIVFIAQTLALGTLTQIRNNYARALLPAAGATGARSLLPALGEMFFDTTLGIPVWYNGADWVNSAGVVV